MIKIFNLTFLGFSRSFGLHRFQLGHALPRCGRVPLTSVRAWKADNSALPRDLQLEGPELTPSGETNLLLETVILFGKEVTFDSS